MKLQLRLVVCLFSGALLAPAAMPAQESPAALAARQQMEEDIKRLSTENENLRGVLESYKRELLELRQRVNQLDDKLTRSQNNREVIVLKENFESLRKAVDDVDKNRVADSKKVWGVLERLKETLAERANSVPKTSLAPPPRDPPSASTPSNPSSSGRLSGWDYVIQNNDNLSTLVVRLRADGKMVTRKMLIDANPTVDWNRLQVGRKIFIPNPNP